MYKIFEGKKKTCNNVAQCEVSCCAPNFNTWNILRKIKKLQLVCLLYLFVSVSEQIYVSVYILCKTVKTNSWSLSYFERDIIAQYINIIFFESLNKF